MKTTTGLALLLAALPAALADLTVNTPAGVAACEPAQITWNDGTPPYYLSLIPAGQPTAQPMKQWPAQDGTSMTWNPVDLPANTNFNVALRDSTGKQVFSALVTIQDSGATCDKDKAANLANASGSAAPAPSASSGGGGGGGGDKLTLAASSTASGASAGSSATHATSGSGTTSHTSSTSSGTARPTGGSNSNAASPAAGPLSTASGLMIAAAFGLVKLGALIF